MPLVKTEGSYVGSEAIAMTCPVCQSRTTPLAVVAGLPCCWAAVSSLASDCSSRLCTPESSASTTVSPAFAGVAEMVPETRP